MYIYGRKMSLRCKKGSEIAENSSFSHLGPLKNCHFSPLGANLYQNLTYPVYTCICDALHTKYMYIYGRKMSLRYKKGWDFAKNTSFSYQGPSTICLFSQLGANFD